MKNLSSNIILVFACALAISCNQPKTKEIAVTQETEINTEEKKEVLAENKAAVNMKVEGMVCAMGCAKFIEDKVYDLNGIVASNVNFEEGTAMFEFDKSLINEEEIEEYINNIHDGQYKAKIASNNDATIDEDGSAEQKESLSSVKNRIASISFPELFTYFLKNLR